MFSETYLVYCLAAIRGRSRPDCHVSKQTREDESNHILTFRTSNSLVHPDVLVSPYRNHSEWKQCQADDGNGVQQIDTFV